MKKKTAIILLFIVAVTAAILGLAACSSSSADFSDCTPVRFVFNYNHSLDGGRYFNSRNPVTYYYKLKEGDEVLISEPEVMSNGKNKVTYTGHTLEGWYKDPQFKVKWDFDKDKLTYDPGTPYEYDTGEGKLTNPDDGHGVILYAHWVEDTNHSFVVAYIEDGVEHELGVYEGVKEGQTFFDYQEFYRRDGYTKIRYYDENGNTVEEFAYPHPGGEQDTAVKIYVEYIEGDYAIISSESDWALDPNLSVYLLNDIDMKGKVLTPLSSYSGKFNGAGHTVSNFKIGYADGRYDLITDTTLADEANSTGENILAISLFGNIENAVIENVSFENATVDINTNNSFIKQIVVAPFALKSVNSTLNGVKFDGSVTITRLPVGLDPERVSIADNLYYYSAEGDGTVIDENSRYDILLPETSAAATPAAITIRKKKSIKELA